MLNGIKLKLLYSKIQTQLFNLIPEKWDRVYLYASIIQKNGNIQTGEMFFYYYPKGILKKNPINVYEVPSKFNVDEEAYLKLVDNLYSSIKEIREEFEKAKEKLWTSLTISIENLKFNVEYDYEDLEHSVYTNEDRHIIWQYKYLDLNVERLSKRERKMLETYLIDQKFKNKNTKQHSENMYKRNIHNIIQYDKIQNTEQLHFTPTKENSIVKQKEKTLDKYELYKEAQKEDENKNAKRNQILNY